MTWPCTRVIARIDARNLTSTRVVARLGMRQEAHLVENERFKGEWSDASWISACLNVNGSLNTATAAHAVRHSNDRPMAMRALAVSRALQLGIGPRGPDG